MKKRNPRGSHEEVQDDREAIELPSHGRDSKTRIKQESHALQELGWSLTSLSEMQLASMALEDELREAVILGAQIKDHTAIKRHKKFLGKLLRKMDADPIRERYDALLQDSQHDVHFMHRLEKTRDHLLGGGEEAMNLFMSQHPSAERQKLRQLVKDAGKEYERGLPPVSARKLYRYLRELLQEEPQSFE